LIDHSEIFFYYGTMSLRVASLKKTFTSGFFHRKKSVEAVKDISFEIRPGEIYALLGPNGAGKSTTIKMIAGLILPTSGEIYYQNQNIKDLNYNLHKKLSAVLEGTRNVYWRLNPEENLHYFANLRGIKSRDIKDRVNELLGLMDIEAKKKNQSQHLSRGMLQKLALSMALVTDPEIILLDEPTLGLDVASSRKIKDVILLLAKKHNKTILLTTHQMSLVEQIADRVGIINHGKIMQEGSVPALRRLFKTSVYRFRIKKSFSEKKNSFYAWSGRSCSHYRSCRGHYRV